MIIEKILLTDMEWEAKHASVSFYLTHMGVEMDNHKCANRPPCIPDDEIFDTADSVLDVLGFERAWERS